MTEPKTFLDMQAALRAERERSQNLADALRGLYDLVYEGDSFITTTSGVMLAESQFSAARRALAAVSVPEDQETQ